MRRMLQTHKHGSQPYQYVLRGKSWELEGQRFLKEQVDSEGLEYEIDDHDQREWQPTEWRSVEQAAH